jgi:hypothetical protein
MRQYNIHPDCRRTLGTRAGSKADFGRQLRPGDGAASRDLSGWHDSESEFTTMTQHQITDAGYAAALAAGQSGAEAEVRAQAVRYVPDRDAIEIVTTRNAGFLIPRQSIGALQDVPTEDLTRLEVWPDGSAIEPEIGASTSACMV